MPQDDGCLLLPIAPGPEGSCADLVKRGRREEEKRKERRKREEERERRGRGGRKKRERRRGEVQKRKVKREGTEVCPPQGEAVTD